MFLEILFFVGILTRSDQNPENHVEKKLPVQPQLEMFKTVLTSFIHTEHELCLLAKKRLHRIAFKIYQDVVKQLSPIPKSYMQELDVL